RSSFGMIVSAAAVKNAASCCVRMCQVSGAASAAALVSLVSGEQAAMPVAVAATDAAPTPAPFKKSRREESFAIDLVLPNWRRFHIIPKSTRLHGHQGAGALQILGRDRVRRPVRQRAQRSCRIVALVLRKGRRTHDEQIV